jgi:hypothetical protein
MASVNRPKPAMTIAVAKFSSLSSQSIDFIRHHPERRR